ncbi:inner membrane-spanning protein YciB [Ostreiculturibacter nitratireducens]|uniref:inner membrane-spanning protein YciB n=1 Tax=Ostreiculturibacter nitratireducens TaxID=3075226 RepID=UPI0031B5C98B
MAERKINPWVKLGLELGPVLAFFAAYVALKDRTFVIAGTEYRGFILATAGFVPVMVAATLALWRLTGKLATMQVVTLVLVVFFGGLTVWLNDGDFFKIKVTIIYTLFAAVLGFGLLRGQSYLALVMEDLVPLQREGWMILTRRLTAFFAGLAILNEVIWRGFSEQAWVYFKTFGLTAGVFVFFIAQGGLLSRYAAEEAEKK